MFFPQKTAFMMCSIIAASVLVPGIYSLGVIGSIIVSIDIIDNR